MQDEFSLRRYIVDKEEMERRGEGRGEERRVEGRRGRGKRRGEERRGRERERQVKRIEYKMWLKRTHVPNLRLAEQLTLIVLQYVSLEH